MYIILLGNVYFVSETKSPKSFCKLLGAKEVSCLEALSVWPVFAIANSLFIESLFPRGWFILRHQKNAKLRYNYRCSRTKRDGRIGHSWCASTYAKTLIPRGHLVDVSPTALLMPKRPDRYNYDVI